MTTVTAQKSHEEEILMTTVHMGYRSLKLRLIKWKE